VPVILTETVGADCFNAALSAGQLVTLDSISSVAKSLGALTVCEKLFDLATSPDKKFEVISRVVTDKDAIRACLSFADDHRYENKRCLPKIDQEDQALNTQTLLEKEYGERNVWPKPINLSTVLLFKTNLNNGEPALLVHFLY